MGQDGIGALLTGVADEADAAAALAEAAEGDATVAIFTDGTVAVWNRHVHAGQVQTMVEDWRATVLLCRDGDVLHHLDPDCTPQPRRRRRWWWR